MRNTVLFSIFILFLIACNKNKYTTEPQLKYKSVNKKKLNRGEDLVFTLGFTDAEGDLTGKLTYQEVAKNCPASNFIDSSFSIPPFPSGKDQAGDILVTLRYIDINPHCAPRNDTAIFKFVVKDKAGHKSDTAVSDQIIIFN